MIKSVLIISVLCWVVRADDQDVQQVHRKVERINLRDFGFTKTNITQRESEPILKKVSAARRYSPDSSVDYDFRERLERRENRRRTEEHGSGRAEERRPLSSPLDWVTDVRGIGGARLAPPVDFPFYDSKLDAPFERPFRPIDQSIRPRRNCSADCVPEKYLKHYLAKGCRPLTDAECRCALSFSCPFEMTKNSTVCRYDGHTYRVGSRIPVHNPCRICECRDENRGRGEVSAQIDCGVGIECPEQVFGLKAEPNCYFAYEHNECCGHQVCNNTAHPKRTEKVCSYRGRQYKMGEKIYPEEDSCMSCLCNDNWSDEKPLESPACRRFRCEFELDRDFHNGCLPIYHEGTCCPIEYMCPKNTTARPSLRVNPNYCYFDGREYPIGSRLSSGNVCVDCQCRAPPDFTCIHKSCPSPSHNCFVGKWDHTVCCQRYICSVADRIRDESQYRSNFYST